MTDAFAAAYHSGAANFGSFQGSVNKIRVQGIRNKSSSTFNDDGDEVLVGEACPGDTQINNNNGPGSSGGVYGDVPLGGDNPEEQWGCEVFVQATDWWTCVSSGGITNCRITETTYEITYENCGSSSGMSSSDDDALCQPTDDNIPIIEPDLDEKEKAILRLRYLNAKGSPDHKSIASLYAQILQALAYDDYPEPATSILFAEIKKLYDSLLVDFLSAHLLTPTLIAKPFVEIALFANLSNFALEGLNLALKSKFGVALINSMRGIKKMPNGTSVIFENITTGNSTLNFRVGLSQSNFMTNLSNGTGRSWIAAPSNSSIFNLEYNGIRYTARPFSGSSGATIDVYEIIGNSVKLLAKFRLL